MVLFGAHRVPQHPPHAQVVLVDNLPKHFTVTDLAQLFRGFPIDESALKVQPDAVHSRGFVPFLPSATETEIEQAVTKVRVFDGNIVICKRIQPLAQQPPPPPPSSSTTVVSNVIQIDYLTPDFSYFDVKTLIEQFGRIVEIRMTVAPGKDGILTYDVPQGRAYVEFEDPKSAQRVVVEAENNPPHPPQCPRPLLIRFATADWKILAPPGLRPNKATVPDPSVEQFYQQYMQNPNMMQPGYYMYGAPAIVYPNNGSNPNLQSPVVATAVTPTAKVGGNTHQNNHVDQQHQHQHIQQPPSQQQQPTQPQQQTQQQQQQNNDVPANWKKIQEIMQEKIEPTNISQYSNIHPHTLTPSMNCNTQNASSSSAISPFQNPPSDTTNGYVMHSSRVATKIGTQKIPNAQQPTQQPIPETDWKVVKMLEASNKAYIQQNKELREKFKTAATERNDSQKKLGNQIQKTKRLEKRYVELREKFLQSQKRTKEKDPIEIAELKSQNVKLTKELNELKNDYDWLQKHASELKESSEIQSKRFASLRALRDQLCPYCSSNCNAADLGFKFLPKKRKGTIVIGGQRKKRKVEEEPPFSDLKNFDHILKERKLNGNTNDTEYLVMWADASKSTWEKTAEICPVLVNIWNRDKSDINSTK